MQPFFDNFRCVLNGMLKGALPDDRHAPSKSMEHLCVARVTIDIFLELQSPEFFICPGSGRIAAALVPVPETSVDKHHCSVLWKYEVGGPGQFLYMESVSEPSGEKKGAKRPFRPSVLSSDARHHATALRGGRDTHGLRSVPLGYLQKQSLRASVRQSERMTEVP